MKKNALIALLAMSLVLLSACSKDEPVEQATSQPAAEEKTSTSQAPALSPAEQARQAVDAAIAAYEAFASQHRSFLWRDTELHISKAREALEKGEIDLAEQEAAIIAKEVELMKEQVDFAKNNWRKFMVNP